MPRFLWPAWACVSALGLQCVAASAQTRPEAPGRSNFQNTLPQAAPRDGGQVQLPATPGAGQEVRADTPVHPTEIRIAGVKSVPFAEVSGLFRDFVGTDTTVGALAEAARKVGQRYSDHGYALSYAYLPEQDFANGVVQVVAIEGYVDRIELRDAPPALERKLRAVAAPIVGERPLTSRTFERYVSLLARLPDVSVDADVPVPGDDGASPLELKIRHRRFTVGAAFDADHPGFEGLLTANVNGLTSWGDRLSASVMAPRGTRDRSYRELDYELPLGNDGLALHANAYRYRGRPSFFTVNGATVRDDYDEERVSLGVRYPFVLRVDSEINGDLSAFAARSGDFFTDPTVPAGFVDSRASTRGLQASLSGTWRRDTHRTNAEAQLVKGANCCGAHQDVPLVALDFTKLRLSANRSDSWGKDAFGTFFTAVVQRTRDWLPGTERINFGGTYFGAGYPTGELSGDSGHGVAAEVNKSFRRDGLVRRIEPYLGVDYARSWLTGAARPQALMSGIAGVRLDAGDRFSLNLGRAKPVGARPFGEAGRPWRWNVQLAAKFW